MSKAIPSRHRNATAQRRTSSKAARSGNSAVKKSKKSKRQDETLTVATPQNSALRVLKEAGIIVPDEIPSDDEVVPLDFTNASSREIGSIQSRFAVRHAHAIFHAAKASTQLVHLKRDLRMAEAKFRIRHSGEKKTDVDALMEDDSRITKLRDKAAQAEATVGLITAVAQGYEDLRNAASREMTRRIGEKAATD